MQSESDPSKTKEESALCRDSAAYGEGTGRCPLCVPVSVAGPGCPGETAGTLSKERGVEWSGVEGSTLPRWGGLCGPLCACDPSRSVPLKWVSVGL